MLSINSEEYDSMKSMERRMRSSLQKESGEYCVVEYGSTTIGGDALLEDAGGNGVR